MYERNFCHHSIMMHKISTIITYIFLSLHGAAPGYLCFCYMLIGIQATAVIVLDDRCLCVEDGDAFRWSCIFGRRSSMLEQSPFCYSILTLKAQLKTCLFAKAYPIC